uniref:Tom1 protein 2 n=1 Tax=Echinococcus granulosus TaxID=6210 RepID=A0A068X0A3_ECHGR|nr:tom1 protein 2 [Echinococcus granulosus]
MLQTRRPGRREALDRVSLVLCHLHWEWLTKISRATRKALQATCLIYSHLATLIHNPTFNPNYSPFFFLFLIPAVAAVFFATAPRTFLNHHQQQQQQQQQHRYQHQQYESSQQLQQASSTTHHSMPSGMYSLSGDQTLVDHEGTVRRLSTAQRERLSQDLTVVQTNLHILNDMLTELQPDAISPDDLELLQVGQPSQECIKCLKCLTLRHLLFPIINVGYIESEPGEVSAM